MGATSNHIAALSCVWCMRKYGYKPATIINVGVGKRSPELDIWLWLLPDARLLGIDPRWSPRGYWTKIKKQPQVALAVGDGSITEAQYCGRCRSLTCTVPEHTKKATVQVSTIDKIVAEQNLQPPFFMWMDIDGSELEALQGATETLKRTGWLNIEMSEWRRGPEQLVKIRQLLKDSRFRLYLRHAHSEDELYRHR